MAHGHNVQDTDSGFIINPITRAIRNEFAFNLDGSGSAQTNVGKKQINRIIDGRSIPNVITFK